MLAPPRYVPPELQSPPRSGLDAAPTDGARTQQNQSRRVRLRARQRRLYKVAVSCETTLALMAATFRIWHRSIWFDEAFSTTIAHMRWANFWHVARLGEFNMVAYYLALRPWQSAFGDSPSAVRMLSALCFVATVPIVCELGRRLFGGYVGLAAGFLFTIHAGMVEYAQEARGYALETLLVSLGALLLVTYVHNGRRAALAGWACCSVLAIYGHFFAVLILVAEIVSLSFLPPSHRIWRRVAPCIGAVVVLCAPIALVARQSDTQYLAWIGLLRHGAVTDTTLFLAGDGGWILRFLVVTGVLVACASCFRRLGLRGRSLGTWSYALVALWATLPLGLAVAASQVQPLIVPKYLIAMIPGIALAVAASLRLIWGRRTLALMLVVVAGLELAGTARTYVTPRLDGWRDLAAQLSKAGTSSDGLVFLPGWQRIALEYYVVQNGSRHSPQPLAPSNPWGAFPVIGSKPPVTYPPSLLWSAARYQRVWLVLGPGIGSSHEPENAAAQAALGTRKLAFERSYGDVSLRRYDRVP